MTDEHYHNGSGNQGDDADILALIPPRLPTFPPPMIAAEQLIAPAKVLLVDDDQELADLLNEYLKREGFEVTWAADGARGTELALSGRFDIVVLDVMMPLCDGFEALASIRAACNTPIVMLTARGDDNDKILGLEQGADDYVSKPCSPRELTARLRAILKRTQGPATETAETDNAPLSNGTLQLWPNQRKAIDNGSVLALTSTEFSLLEVLIRHAGTAVSKETLAHHALRRSITAFDRSIDVHIHSIRNKLKPLPDGRSRIHTVIRKGYLLIPE